MANIGTTQNHIVSNSNLQGYLIDFLLHDKISPKTRAYTFLESYNRYVFWMIRTVHGIPICCSAIMGWVLGIRITLLTLHKRRRSVKHIHVETTWPNVCRRPLQIQLLRSKITYIDSYFTGVFSNESNDNQSLLVQTMGLVSKIQSIIWNSCILRTIYSVRTIKLRMQRDDLH